MTDLPSSAIGTLRLFANTQTQVDLFSDQLIQSVKEGEANPIEVLITLRALEKVSERVVKEILPNSLREAGNYPGSSFEFNGNKIEKAELGTKYDYSGCNDPVYTELAKEANVIIKKVKEREAFLKAINGSETVVDKTTGEFTTIYAPLKTSTTGLKVTIK
jgi:hypothetical protein